MSSSVPVTVVVPVFEGLDEVAGCLDSVVRHAGSSRVAMELLVIDDASPNPAMGPFLDAWAGGVSAGSDGSAGSVPVTVVHHGENLGFVQSVNEGFRPGGGRRGDLERGHGGDGGVVGSPGGRGRVGWMWPR